MLKIFSKIKRALGNTIYYPGCLTNFVLEDVKKNYELILNHVGIPAVEIKDLKCCGSPVKNAGYFEDCDEIIEFNKKILKDYGVSKIIFNCPSCYSTFKREYNLPEYVELLHITQILSQKLNKIKEGIFENESCCYHDPCHLGRYEGIYKVPREILKHLGFKILEMENSFEKSFCCGGGASLRTYSLEISRRIAEKRIKEAVETKANCLITTCPMCYLQLKEAAENIKANIKVFELSQVIVNAIS